MAAAGESTGVPRVDATLAGIADAYRRRLPTVPVSIYVLGSYGHGTPLPMSDVDVLVVTRDPADETSATAIANWCASVSALPLDIAAVSVAALRSTFAAQVPFLHHAARLVDGPDIRREVPMPDPDSYTRSAILLARHCVGLLRGGDWISTAGGYPNADDEFFGYVNWGRGLPPWYPALPNTKLFVAAVSRLVIASLAVEAQVMATSRAQYRAAVDAVLDAEHRDMVAATHDRCRAAWSYLVPGDPIQRAELREICRRTLSYEERSLARFEAWEAAGSKGAG